MPEITKKAALIDPIRKSAITAGTSLQSGGILSREQFDAFMVLVWEYSNFLNTIRTVTVTNKSGEIDKLGYSAPITRGANEIPFTDTKQPTFSKVLYDCVKGLLLTIFQLRLKRTTLKAHRSNTIMNAFTSQVAIDHTDLCYQW